MLPALLLAAAAATGTEPQVCPDPASPCLGFREHDLSFPLPKDGVARAEVRSAPFFAVLLASGRRCGFAEKDRLEAQALFPGTKVFSARFGCDGDAENNVNYTNVDPRAGFLAVHAGADPKAAQAMLERVKATGRFPGANLRKMQAVFVYP